MLTVGTVVVLAFLLGLAFCLIGYRFFLVMLPIWGFFAGFWIGAMGASVVLGTGFLATATGWVIAIVLGLVLAVLSHLFYAVGVAIVAAGFGAMLGSGVMTAIGFAPGLLVTVVAIVSALIVAGLTFLFNLQRYVIIAITVIVGAQFLLVSVLLLFGFVSLQDLQAGGNVIKPIIEHSPWWLLVWLALAIAGFVFQVRTNRDYEFSRDDLLEDWG